MGEGVLSQGASHFDTILMRMYSGNGSSNSTVQPGYYDQITVQ